MKKIIYTMLVIQSLLFFASPILSNGKLTVAVIGPQPDLRAEIESAMSKTDFLQPVERTRIDSLLTEMKLGQQGVLKEGTYAKAGNTLGASYLVLVEKGSTSFRIVHTLC
jgi:hypothetical protein